MHGHWFFLFSLKTLYPSGTFTLSHEEEEEEKQPQYHLQCLLTHDLSSQVSGIHLIWSE
jgi:hypothetical protein